MEWNHILSIRTWTGLRAVIAEPDEVLPGIYRAGNDAYLQTQPYDSEFTRGLLDAPFITLAYWAPSLLALRRCAQGDTTVMVPSPWAPPPTSLLLGTSGTYSELLETTPQAKRRTAERAVYSNEGKFVHKLIKSGRFTFCFLAEAINDLDIAYAVEVALA